MTRLGYGEEMRRWRVEKHRENDRMHNAGSHDFTEITAGSKAEGLTCLLEGDLDLLTVLNGVLCVEAGISIQTILDGVEVYRMDTRVYPGHCRLLQEGQTHTRWE
ncbi:hypothetical protein DPMN_048664 [Dreissena polymorpha]|uniref:Uncharacterized protein n=2 Tax=Dreissena polymorpha TaxID=45954 RepID=A0A9D4DC13_DREPO|nr:hypothetical protein DPMN_048664 [Dreissena polymorpha]